MALPAAAQLGGSVNVLPDLHLVLSVMLPVDVAVAEFGRSIVSGQWDSSLSCWARCASIWATTASCPSGRTERTPITADEDVRVARDR
jgi:hypothetical protein